MNSECEFSRILTSRETYLRLLSRLYASEVDTKLFKELVQSSFPEDCDDVAMAKGYRLISSYLHSATLDPITDLAVDYARVFLGAGIQESKAAYPYESVYTSPKRLMMQDARDQVLAAYRTHGLDKSDSVDVPEDHIALQCDFLAHLSHQTIGAFDLQDWARVSSSLIEQQNFLTAHLLNWVPQFCEDIQKYAQTDFYKGLAKITAGFLHLENEILDGLIAEATAQVA